MRMGLGTVAAALAILATSAFADIIRIDYAGTIVSSFDGSTDTGVSGIVIYDSETPGTFSFGPTDSTYGALSHTFRINSVAYGVVLSNYGLYVEDDGTASSAVPEDEFYATETVTGPSDGSGLQIVGGGFRFVTDDLTVLSNFALPTSAADLAGFVGSDRQVTMTLYDAQAGSYAGVSGDITGFSVANLGPSPVPEPGTVALVALVALGYGIVRLRKRA